MAFTSLVYISDYIVLASCALGSSLLDLVGDVKQVHLWDFGTIQYVSIVHCFIIEL